MLFRALQFLFAIAVASLVLNDVARLAFPSVFQSAMVQATSSDEEKQDDNNPTSTLLEEEVKHKATREQFGCPPFDLFDEIDVAVAHLITDDEVRHLAFLPIFTHPPDRA